MRYIEEGSGNRFGMRSLILIGILLCSVWSNAQVSFNKLSYSFTPGFLLAHRADLNNLESHLLGFELNYEQRSFDSDWALYYGEPVIGVGLSYFNILNKQAGDAIALHGNFKFRVIAVMNGSVSMRFASGLGVVTEHFDVMTNRRNQAIGSALNAFMQTSLLYDRYTRRGSYSVGITVSHFSNGAIRVPNLGYNIPSLSLRYSPRDIEKDRITGSDTGAVRSGFTINSMIGFKQRNYAKPVDFVQWGVLSRWNYQPTVHRSWRIGADIAFDKTYMYQRDNNTDLSEVSLSDQMEVGVAGGHEWKVGSLWTLFEIGAYVRKPADFKRPFYQRMGFRYMFTENLGLQWTLKFHRGVADYFEWGIAYSIRG